MNERIDIDLCDGGDTDVYTMRWEDVPIRTQAKLILNGHVSMVSTTDPSRQVIRFSDKHLSGPEPTSWFGSPI